MKWRFVNCSVTTNHVYILRRFGWWVMPRLPMDAKFRLSEEGKKIAEQIAVSKLSAIGKMAIDFEQQDVDGRSVKLSQNLLIGPDGVIIAKNLRGAALEEKLEEVLK